MTLTEFSRLLTGDSEYQNAQYLLTRLHSRNVSAYDELSHILKIIAPVFSAEEYAAFLTEGSYISDELFLLGCLTAHGQCLEIGAFDEDFRETVAAFAAQRSGVTLENTGAFDPEDPEAFFEALQEAVDPFAFSLVVFASEDFFEQFFLFLVPADKLQGESVVSEYRMIPDGTDGTNSPQTEGA